MGHIKEPKGVDLVIKSKQLTKEQEASISKFIREYKEKRSKRTIQKRTKKSRDKSHA